MGEPPRGVAALADIGRSGRFPGGEGRGEVPRDVDISTNRGCS